MQALGVAPFLILNCASSPHTTLQHSTPHCNAVHHFATQYTTLQHMAGAWVALSLTDSQLRQLYMASLVLLGGRSFVAAGPVADYPE